MNGYGIKKVKQRFNDKGVFKLDHNVKKRKDRLRRHKRVRKKIFGTAERPRLCVFRSLRNIYAQVIDDEKRETLLTSSTLLPEIRNQISYGGNKSAAKLVGKQIAHKAIEIGITNVVLDRGGNIYHGRVKALAEAAREVGIKF